MLETDPIERFVRAKQDKDTEAAVACFAPDAVVHDDGRIHTGADAVRDWLAGVASTFDLTYELVGIQRDGAATAASVLVTGDFPGSPITFRYDAEVVDDRITRLTVEPS